MCVCVCVCVFEGRNTACVRPEEECYHKFTDEKCYIQVKEEECSTQVKEEGCYMQVKDESALYTSKTRSAIHHKFTCPQCKGYTMLYLLYFLLWHALLAALACFSSRDVPEGAAVV